MPRYPVRLHYALEVYDAAEELYNSKTPAPSAAWIAEALRAGFTGRDGHVRLDTPGERAVQTWIRDGVVAQVDEQRPWRYTDCSPEDARLVFDVLADVRDLIDQLPQSRAVHPFGISLRRARAVAVLRRLAPELGAIETLALATVAASGDEDAVHEYLLLRPWTPEGAALIETAEGRPVTAMMFSLVDLKEKKA